MKENKRHVFFLKLHVEKQELLYQIIWSKRKTFAISIDRNGVIIARAPWQMKQKEIEKMVISNKDKIYQHYVKVREHKSLPPIIQIGQSEVVPFYGKSYRLYIHETNRRECLKEDGEIIEIWVQSSNAEYKQRIQEMLEKWYRKKGKEVFAERANFYAARLHTSFERIYIKDQKSRWGSCSNHRNMNFNWRLLMMPCEILDYCVVHELAHTIEMNHSKDFWKIVAMEFPKYKEVRKYLKENAERFRVE